MKTIEINRNAYSSRARRSDSLARKLYATIYR